MNNERRKIIGSIMDRLDPFIEEIEAVLGDEQAAFENMPEGLQQSARGEAVEAAIEALQEARDQIEEAKNSLSTATEAA